MASESALVPRRRLLMSSMLLGATTVMACKHAITCPPAQLSAEDAKVRATLKYSDQSPYPDKVCNGCQQYLPNKDGECGGCKLIKGPIHPAGYCAAFSAKG